jgi:hypothetical protein
MGTPDRITQAFCNRWTCSGSKAEIALLVKVQSSYSLNKNEPISESNQSKLLDVLEEHLHH